VQPAQKREILRRLLHETHERALGVCQQTGCEYVLCVLDPNAQDDQDTYIGCSPGMEGFVNASTLADAMLGWHRLMAGVRRLHDLTARTERHFDQLQPPEQIALIRILRIKAIPEQARREKLSYKSALLASASCCSKTRLQHMVASHLRLSSPFRETPPSRCHPSSCAY